MALYAFDGTWNAATLDDNVPQDNETNVAHFCLAYDSPQKFYRPGPGTRFGKVGKIVGGAFGAGGHERLREMYHELCTQWAQGDHTIDVIGFSRGAALALDFANLIQDNGIRQPGTKMVVAERPQLRFLGLWDVVGSFGVPINAGPLEFQEINFGHELTLPDHVEYCFHAMAMDERRQTFRVTRVMNAYEVWFRGVHSDVGGGNGNTGLSAIALRWMLQKAQGAGLPINEALVQTHLARIDATAPIKPPSDLIPNEYRGFLKGDRFHYTVTERPGHNNAPEGSNVESEAEEAEAIPISEIPPRGVEVPSSTFTGSQLQVGQDITLEVEAHSCWNRTGIAVQPGEQYDITAAGQYLDNEYVCTTDGFESPNWLMRRFERSRRVENAPWFKLIASVHPSPILEGQQPETTNVVTNLFKETFHQSISKYDAESQLVAVGTQGSIEVKQAGYLYLFANDAPWAYANNQGSVRATVMRRR